MTKEESNATQERYARQGMLEEIGREGQEKLRRARVLVVGTGGLGSPITLYLTGAGIGRLGLVDEDTVSVSNLHRQVLYGEAETGMSKVEQAARRLRALNSEVEIRTYPCRLTAGNAAEIIAGYDIVVDACDNFATRYVLNDTCRALGKPYVYGAIQGFCGQVSVFCTGPQAKTYRDLYPDEEAMLRMPPPPKGVVGMTPAVVGSVEAHEVMKLVCGYGTPLAGKLWTIDLRDMQSYTLDL
ncbi:MAG: HesA/MoeB/ThiF family protein [Clostridium sp.]|nr:HesA/MoeB/ThiF family protein [Clostridium sp.]